MEAAGLITGHRDKQGSRPEKAVYQVHGAGADKFRELLLQTLQIEYRPTLDIDGTLYFPDALEEGALADSLRRHAARLKQILSGAGSP
ncbi:hypothetical protein SDC9_148453 [bioreactor metagenome]|uniref:Uncharacterized protein n=1 Tax=bioreactor metagenome TaxID=1076179 RepID=A0A645EHL6_9ZZZZ